MQLQHWQEPHKQKIFESFFIDKLQRCITDRRVYIDTSEYHHIIREIECIASLKDSVVGMANCGERAGEMVGAYYDDPDIILQRLHEVAGVGTLYSCQSSLPIVQAFFKFGLFDKSGAVEANTIIGRGHVAPTFYALRHILAGFPLAFLFSVHDVVPAVVQQKWGFANSMQHSLGAGLAMAVGKALCGNSQKRTFCFVGDGELNEGVTFEAIRIAYENELKKFTMVVDNNHTGIEKLPKSLNVKYLQSYFDNVFEVDGGDSKAVHAALELSEKGTGRDAIVCHTEKKRHSYQRKQEMISKSTCQYVSEIIQDIRSEKTTHVFTADFAGRFGLRKNNNFYINTGLSETASVGMAIALPEEDLKFVLTDDKYLLNSIDTILSAVMSARNLHIVAGRKNAVWGGPLCTPNIFSVMPDVEFFELVDPDHLLALIKTAMIDGKNHIYIMNDQDDSCLTSLRQHYSFQGESSLFRKGKNNDVLLVSTESVASRVRQIASDFHCSHLRFLQQSPELSRSELLDISSYEEIIVIEYNIKSGGLGEYLESVLRKPVRKITAEGYEYPSVHSSMSAIDQALEKLKSELREKLYVYNT